MRSRVSFSLHKPTCHESAVAFVLEEKCGSGYAQQIRISDRRLKAMLKVHSCAPEPELLPFIRAYVQREANLGLQELVEPVVARLGVMLEFEFAGPYEIRNYGSETLEDPNPISVIGPQSWRRSRLIIRGHVESLVVMFHPFGFSTLFGIETASLSDGGTEGHSVLGSRVSRLHQRLGNARGFVDRVDLLNRFFLQQAGEMRGPDPASAVLAQLTRPGMGIRIDDAAKQAGISCRQLERKSLAYAGLSPKLLARISRFSHVLRLQSERSLTWTQIAHSAGYHDHMHMIRDFRVFAGSAPTSALREIAADHLIHYALDKSMGRKPRD